MSDGNLKFNIADQTWLLFLFLNFFLIIFILVSYTTHHGFAPLQLTLGSYLCTVEVSVCLCLAPGQLLLAVTAPYRHAFGSVGALLLAAHR